MASAARHPPMPAWRVALGGALDQRLKTGIHCRRLALRHRFDRDPAGARLVGFGHDLEECVLEPAEENELLGRARASIKEAGPP